MTKEEEILQSMKYWPNSDNTGFQFQMPENTVEFVRKQFKDKDIFHQYSGSISLTKAGDDKLNFQGSKDKACEVFSSIFDCLITTELFDRYITDPPPPPPPPTPAINNTPSSISSQNSQGKRQQKPNNHQNTNNNYRQGSKQGGSQRPNGKNNPNHSHNKSSNNPQSNKIDTSKAEAILSGLKYWEEDETTIVIEDEDQKIKNGFKEKKGLTLFDNKLSNTPWRGPKHSQFNVDDPSLLFNLTSKALSILYDTEITEDLLRKHISPNPNPTEPSQASDSKPQTSPAKQHGTPSTKQHPAKQHKQTSGKQPAQPSGKQHKQPPPKQPAPPPAKQPTTQSTSQPAPPPTRPDVISLNSQQYMKLLEKCGLPPNSPPITTLIFMPNSD